MTVVVTTAHTNPLLRMIVLRPTVAPVPSRVSPAQVKEAFLSATCMPPAQSFAQVVGFSGAVQVWVLMSHRTPDGAMAQAMLWFAVWNAYDVGARLVSVGEGSTGPTDADLAVLATVTLGAADGATPLDDDEALPPEQPESTPTAADTTPRAQPRLITTPLWGLSGCGARQVTPTAPRSRQRSCQARAKTSVNTAAGWAPDTPYRRSTTTNGTPVAPKAWAWAWSAATSSR